jgi:hypothetical protein
VPSRRLDARWIVTAAFDGASVATASTAFALLQTNVIGRIAAARGWRTPERVSAAHQTLTSSITSGEATSQEHWNVHLDACEESYLNKSE